MAINIYAPCAESNGILDPYYNYTTAIFNAYGNNGTINILDSSYVDTLSISNSGVTVSTSQSAPAGEYLYFNGSSYFAATSANNNFNFGTGDFTIEAYVYSPQFGTVAYPCFIYGNNFYFNFNAAGKLNIYFGYGASNISGNTSLSPNTLYHVAWVRINGVMYFYVNGVLDFSTTSASASANLGNLQIGWTSGAGYYQGYAKVRITKGIGRYTSNFTPPTFWDNLNS